MEVSEMCILSATVDKVAATRLFTCACEDGKRQFLVYSNTVDTPITNNTMVLPVPNPDTVQFFNLSHYKKFFDDVKHSFHNRYEEHNTRSLAYASRSASISDTLPVYAVGSYNVSIVPAVEDFDRLKPNEFSIDPHLPSLLSTSYGPEFGYLICKLRKGNHSYHPFAYSHQIHPDRLLFLPTYHIHPDGSVLHRDSKADWDHVIYAASTDLEQANIPIDRGSSDYSFGGWKVQWDKLPSEIRWAKNCHGQRIAVTGHKVNKDLWLRNTKDFSRNEHRYQYDPEDYRRTDFHFSEDGLRNLRRAFGSL